MKNVWLISIFIGIFLLIDVTFINLKSNVLEDEMRFVYISYIEYLNNFQGNSVIINKSIIDKMIDNVVLYNFNTIILHTSPFSDAIYKSKNFPYSYTLTGVEGKNPGFDYLEYFIKKAHSKKVKVHAWINPYRVSSGSDVTKLDDSNPALKFLNTENISISDKGIYYDPTSEEVKTLLIEQVRELINNYDLDGIHLDDYFYVDFNIDKEEYQNYQEQGGKLNLQEFRLMHTNDLIKRLGTLIKKMDENIVFSIAPDGNINNNYTYHYADVKTWIKEGYIDIIMPQIYYGFNNQYLPFEKAYDWWFSIVNDSNSRVLIIPVLAFYKVGNLDDGAGSGKREWLANGVIEKQIVFLQKRDDYEGFGLFRYDYMFNEKISNEIGRYELKKIRPILTTNKKSS